MTLYTLKEFFLGKIVRFSEQIMSVDDCYLPQIFSLLVNLHLETKKSRTSNENEMEIAWFAHRNTILGWLQITITN